MAQADSVAAADRFLAFFSEVKRLYRKATGAELEAYKATEPQCLIEVFDALLEGPDRGLDYVGRFLHSLVWAQCLENGNHRTSILFLQSFLEAAGVDFPRYGREPEGSSRFEAAINEWSARSKAILRRRGEPGFAQSRLKPEHHRLTGPGWMAS